MNEKESGKKETGSPAGAEVGNKAIKYFLYTEILKTMTKRQEERRRGRRFPIKRQLLEINGRPGGGAQILDLSTNGARLYLPFTQPFMSQISFKFPRRDQNQVESLVGRVIWSRPATAKGWYYVGVQFYQNYWEMEKWLRLEEGNPL